MFGLIKLLRCSFPSSRRRRRRMRWLILPLGGLAVWLFLRSQRKSTPEPVAIEIPSRLTDEVLPPPAPSEVEAALPVLDEAAPLAPTPPAAVVPVEAVTGEAPADEAVELAEAVEAAEVAVPVSPPAPAAADDLKRIEGIGPKISGVLQAAGITTFAQLAAADVQQLEQVLREAELRLANPATWPEQAALAAEGRWDDLEQLQGRLTAGRRT